MTPADEFAETLSAKAYAFGVELDEEMKASLLSYFELVRTWNPRLHLVAPSTPSEFATRHVLESLAAVPFLARGSRVVDVGSGAGLPIIPCLVARPDLSAQLVESSMKKSVFLKEALSRVGRRNGVEVLAERFEKLTPPEADYLTCRALDRFTELLPALLPWASRIPTLLLYGGPSLQVALDEAAIDYQAIRLPESERRYLFVASRT